MEDMLLPFRRNSKAKEEAKEEIKENVGTDLAMEHRAKARIREADLEFEKAFAEVMGIAFKGEKKSDEEEAPAQQEDLAQAGNAEPEPPERAEKKRKEPRWPERNREGGLKAIVEMAGGKTEISKPAAQPSGEEAVLQSAEAEKKTEIVQKVLAEMKARAAESEANQEPCETKEVDPELKKKQQEKWATFNFWYSDKKASSYAEFKSAIKAISDQSLEHHAQNNDFSKYLREFYDKKTADRIESLEKSLRSGELRAKILKAL